MPACSVGEGRAHRDAPLRTAPAEGRCGGGAAPPAQAARAVPLVVEWTGARRRSPCPPGARRRAAGRSSWSTPSAKPIRAGAEALAQELGEPRPGGHVEEALPSRSARPSAPRPRRGRSPARSPARGRRGRRSRGAGAPVGRSPSRWPRRRPRRPSPRTRCEPRPGPARSSREGACPPAAPTRVRAGAGPRARASRRDHGRPAARTSARIVVSPPLPRWNGGTSTATASRSLRASSGSAPQAARSFAGKNRDRLEAVPAAHQSQRMRDASCQLPYHASGRALRSVVKRGLQVGEVALALAFPTALLDQVGLADRGGPGKPACPRSQAHEEVRGRRGGRRVDLDSPSALHPRRRPVRANRAARAAAPPHAPRAGAAAAPRRRPLPTSCGGTGSRSTRRRRWGR